MHARTLIVLCPVGTGKSVTGSHLAYAFITSNSAVTTNSEPDERIRCVMYCGPSNKSVDVVLGKSALHVCHLTEKIFANRVM